MNDIERLFGECDEALSSAGMGLTGYEKQDIAAVADGMKCLLVYVRSAHRQVYKELDNPLYKDFVNAATGALADIRLDEITTENTFRMEVHNEIRSAGYPRYDNAVNSKLTISDFMGITEVEPGEGIPVLENVDSVGWFKYMFRMDYEAQGFSRAEVREILKEYVSLGEFDHKGYHPVKGFVSGVLDVTIVKPAIEAITGRDLITHERLTDFERGMQGVNAVIGVITLGQGAAAAKAAGEGIFKTVFKTWAVDALSDTAAYTVGSICDENGVPLGITLVLSTLTGCSVSKKAGKYLLTDMASGAVTEYTAEEVQSLLREANADGLAEDGIEIFERMSKSGEEIIEGAKREKEALEAAVKGIKAADVTDTVTQAKAAGNIDSLTNVVKAADGTNVVEKVLKKPLTEKKTLSEGLMAKAVGNINSIINAVKTGENSADAIQQAVNGIKAIDITETIKQVEIPKKNTVNEVLSKNAELSEILTEEERRYYEALRRGSQAGLTQAELLGIGKVDEYLALIKVDYDEVLALRKGVSGGGTEVLEEVKSIDDAVGAVLKGGSRTSWADFMSPEDAARYNHWEDLREAGLDQQKINDILLTNRGYRPDPTTYLSPEYINRHLELFSDGAVKISSVTPTGQAGPPGGTFVMPKSVADGMIQEANGSVSKLEQLLRLEPGTLGDSPVRLDIAAPQGLRMPSGNELGANEFWIPGGSTGGGIPEAIIDSPLPEEFISTPIFE